MNDGLLAANSVESMEKIVTDIKGSFDIEDLGKPTQLFSIKISRNHELGGTHISQPSFIDTITKQFKIIPGHSIHAPIDPNIELQGSSQEEIIPDLLYAALIGKLLCIFNMSGHCLCNQQMHPIHF